MLKYVILRPDLETLEQGIHFPLGKFSVVWDQKTTRATLFSQGETHCLDVISDFSDTFLFISDRCIIFSTFDVNKIFIITNDLKIKYIIINRSLDNYKFNRFECKVCHDKCVITYERGFVCIRLDGEIGKTEDSFFIDDFPIRVDCDKIVYKRLYDGSEFTVLLNENL